MKNLSNKLLIARLTKLNACSDSIAWLGTRDLKTAWEECSRPDWMLWLAGHSKKLPVQKLVAVACACARTSLQYVPAGENRPRLAIEAAEGWIAGRVSIEEVNAARNAVSAARDAAWAANSAANSAAWAASYTANSAAWAASYAANSAAWDDASYAARAASGAVSYAVSDAAAQGKCANLLREIFSYTDL